MKSDNFILFSETWILCCYYHLISCSGTSLGWKRCTGFTGFVLDLTGEVTDATCAPQLQLHLKNINQSKTLNLQWVPQKDIQDQAVEPIIAADLWAPADIKRKAQVQNLSDPSLRDSSFYTLSGPLCRAQVLRMI